MIFKNLTMFRFNPMISAQLLAMIDEAVEDHPVLPLPTTMLRNRGFMSPYGHNRGVLAPVINGTLWLTIGGADKILPPAAVAREVQKAIDAHAERTGNQPKVHEVRKIKREVIEGLVPRALEKPFRMDVMIDTLTGVVAVDTASRKQAEDAVREIRMALNGFPVLPLNAELAPSSVMTGLVAGEQPPEGMAIGYEAMMEDGADGKARFANMQLASHEIAEHLKAGMFVTRLALVTENSSFILGNDLIVRRYKLVDGALDAIERPETEDEMDAIRAEIGARMALQVGEFRDLFHRLEGLLRISGVRE